MMMVMTAALKVTDSLKEKVRSYREESPPWKLKVPCYISGSALLLWPFLPFFHSSSLQAVGPISGIALIVFSLFGDLPPQVAWVQRLGSWLFPGIALGTILLLLPYLLPGKRLESSLNAFSPAVWAAYISIVLVSLSFQRSALPGGLYRYCQSLRLSPTLVIPLYVFIAGLLGNIFDGVSIIAISVVIFFALLERPWVIRASFALLFGGLISNLITVAAEPTNIKFQDVLNQVFLRSPSPFWVNNWPISVLGILFPTLWLAFEMRAKKATWNPGYTDGNAHLSHSGPAYTFIERVLSLSAISLLGIGILVHAFLLSTHETIPLYLLLLPAGSVALMHLFVTQSYQFVWKHIVAQWPVWGKLMLIFSLLWFLTSALDETHSMLGAFFFFPEWLQYGFMLILALFSSVTDNVAIAAMLGSIIMQHPLPIWEIRLLLILLTWSGGFTPFGCLQSLALNTNLEFSTREWLMHVVRWAMISLVGGLLGLLITTWRFP